MKSVRPLFHRHTWSRRDVLRRLFWSASAAPLAACNSSVPMFGGGGSPAPVPMPEPLPPPVSRFAGIGPLLDADANGLRLPAGFSSRVIAVSGLPVLPSAYVWHIFPDAGATYATDDGGWIYTSNSEVPGGLGGAGAVRFDAQGNIVDAYRILGNTSGNCAGGKSTWGTWLSCEENASGLTWDCDPFGTATAVSYPKLGLFNHEAAVVDPVNKVIYETEDEGDGRLYRFVPSAADWPAGAAKPALQDGVLQVLRFADGARGLTLDDAGLAVSGRHAVIWEDVAQTDQPQGEVRAALGAEAPGSRFRGGEGLWYFDGLVYFSTKSDNRIWCLDVSAQTVEVIYDFATAPNPILSGVDNLTVSEFGDVLVAEDGGDMNICVILPDRTVLPLLQARDLQAGTELQSEITGPAFSPDGSRLYFSAQRSGLNGLLGPGITFEVTLPFQACPSGACP